MEKYIEKCTTKIFYDKLALSTHFDLLWSSIVTLVTTKVIKLNIWAPPRLSNDVHQI